MRKVVVIFILAVALVSAQEIYGVWLDRTSGTELVLGEDGGYRWAGSGGNFWIEKGSMMFRDALSNEIASYAIAFAGDVMQLTDYWMGGRIVLVRKGSPAEGLPMEVILEDLESVSPELASKDGFILREDETRTAFEVLEFVTGKRLSEEEAGTLLDAWIKGFEADPAKVKNEMGELAAVRDHLYRIRDPWEVAGFYLRLLTDAHDGAKADTQEVLGRAVTEHLDFLSFDKEEKLWLTDRGLEAYLDYVSFLVTLAEGKAVALPETVRDSLSYLIVKEFGNYPPKEREFIASAPVLYAFFGYAWNEADASIRAEIAREILGDLFLSDADYGTLAPGMTVARAAVMDDVALKTLDKVLALDHVTAMKNLVDGRDWPYYYEISAP